MQYTSSSENYSSSLRDSPSRWGGKDDKGYVYKKSSYQYSSNGNNNTSYQNKNADQNIDQLDALLEDLKNERQITTRERELLPTASYRTIERERKEPSGTITKTTRVVKSSKQLGPHQLSDDVETFSTSDYSTLKSANYTSFQDTLLRNEYQNKERQYDIGHSPGSGHHENKTKVYEINRTVNNTDIIPTANTVTTTTKTSSSANIDKELQDIALGDDILPVPGTKVTTTVRTYTYEIPAGSTSNTINRNQRLTNTSYNSSQQHETNISTNYSPQPRPVVPQTVVYNTESYSTLNRNNDRPVVTNQSYEIREHKESNTIHNTSVPGPHPQDVNISPGPGRPILPTVPGGTNRTVVYNIHKTNNIHTIDEPNRYPPHSPNTPHGGPHSPNTPLHSGPQSSPLSNLPPGGTTNRYFYKETSNVINTLHGPGPNEPNLSPQKRVPITYSPSSPQGNGYPPSSPHGNGYPPSSPPANGYPPHGDGYPPNTSTYSYKYTTTTNNRRGPGPDYGTPSPFPVDGVEFPITNGNPPQRVDELMQSFGNDDSVDRGVLENPHRKREIETAVASPNQQHVPSVNKAGKEIYYPPGHETMITKREEMAAGSAAGGRWAKGSGMYEYESGYKSKTKTKSGGAMVPVCLPLCCAMPCSIM